MDKVSQQTDDFLRALSAVLADARKSAGLSQVELAVRSGLSQSHLSFVEKAQRWPSAETVKRIALALGTSASALISDAESSASGRR